MVVACKKDFPILKRTINKHPLAYLDNAASTQKPQQVLDAMMHYYTYSNANVSRGVHTLADESTSAFEHARKTVANFFNVKSQQVIFTSGTTDAMNFIAHSIKKELATDDEILLTLSEHHANLLPWQRLAQETGAKLVYTTLTAEQEVDVQDIKNKLGAKTKFVCMTHTSNVTGAVTPLAQVVELAQSVGAKTIIDGAQAAGHLTVNLKKLGADFYACSAHKLYGPQGIGVLIVQENELALLSPYRVGGGAVASVSMHEHTLLDAPHCFEAGTPNVAGAVGFGAAIEYLKAQGLAKLHQHDLELTRYAWDELKKIPQATLYGPNPHKTDERAAIVSFTIDTVHAHDVAQILDQYGVAIRSGTHCAQPLHEHLSLTALNRASFACYNEKADVDQLITGLHAAIKLFAGETHE